MLAAIVVTGLSPGFPGVSDAVAQATWSLSGTSFSGYCEAYADDPLEPPPHPTCQTWDTQSAMVAGMFGKDMGGGSRAWCKLSMFYGPLLGGGRTRFWIDGIGTSTVVIEFQVFAKTAHKADRVFYYAYGLADLLASADLSVVGVPNGTPIKINYGWSAASSLNNPPEGLGDDDSSYVDGASFTVNGGQLVPSGYNHYQPPKNTAGKFGGGNNSFAWTAGTPFTVAAACSTYVKMTNPGKVPMNRDLGWAWFRGKIILALDSLPQPPWPSFDPTSADQLAAFSVDIGSDAEFSDPYADATSPDANEVFDPGDAYPLSGPPLPSGGANGPIDDGAMWGIVDPPPTPPVPPNAGAPTCSGPTGVMPGDVDDLYFDLDGLDALDVSLSDMIDVSIPVDPPILKFASDCIHIAEHLAISYDDDMGGHYVGDMYLCEVPVNSSVPMGTTAARDEILALDILIDVTPPFEALEVGALDEESVHQNFAPNPDADSARNDDVDAFDICQGTASCPTLYFSPDHEATFTEMASIQPLDPGGIYETGPTAGFLQVIDEAVHLGLSEDTDIDAFEFVWTIDPASPDGDELLTLLFSVDDDDYLTLGDESGGLDPGMIYASYMNGSYFEFLEDPLFNDVDAITAWRAPFYVTPYCYCGVSGDVDGSGGVPTPLDVTFLVKKVYKSQDALYDYTATCPWENGDVDCSGGVATPLDVTFLVMKVYKSQDALCDRCATIP